MPYLKRVLVIATAILLWGCPVEENCQKVMQCEDDAEMVCGKNDAGCGEDCHYFVHEYCHEYFPNVKKPEFGGYVCRNCK